MENFDEVIKQYAAKIVHPDNENVVKYTIKRKPNATQYDLSRYKDIPPGFQKGKTDAQLKSKTRMRVKTPDGIFDSIMDAAEYYNLSPAAITYKCGHWTEDNFFYETPRV